MILRSEYRRRYAFITFHSLHFKQCWEFVANVIMNLISIAIHCSDLRNACTRVESIWNSIICHILIRNLIPDRIAFLCRNCIITDTKRKWRITFLHYTIFTWNSELFLAAKKNKYYDSWVQRRPSAVSFEVMAVQTIKSISF